MFRKRMNMRILLAGTFALVAVVALGAVAIGPKGFERMYEKYFEAQKVEPEFPTALGKHIEKLAEASPVGDLAEGPGSAEEAKLLAMAYPASDISAQKVATMKAAAGKKKYKLPTGKGKDGQWVSVGPSEALYPATELRNSSSYVPAAYVAAGRTTSIAISPECKKGNCRAWIGAAGGGIWRTKDALDKDPKWDYVSVSFGINSIGSITVDPNDPKGKTLWVGTGEANACGSGCIAGVGLYKSTNGGDSWDGPIGQAEFGSRGVGTIAVKPGDPNTIYAASARAGRSASSVATGGVVTVIPGAAKWGLYKSTDGGATWSFIHNGAATTAGCTGDALEAGNGTPCSPRGVRRVAIDPADPNTVYAGSYARGIWRSNDGGATWVQIKASLNSGQTTTRPEFAVTLLPNGKTRMYVAEGNVGAPYSRLFRSDDVRSGSPAFADLTSSDPADPGYGTYDFCTGQCWYDAFVVTPKGYPDVVYVGGSYGYGETGGISNGRAVVLSTDAGVTSTDMTMDGTDPVHPNGLHPDEHSLVVNPENPYQFFEAGDGGIMRSSGKFSDASSWCAPRGLGGDELTRCQQLLSKVPSKLESVNKGLTTLQFQSLSVSPFDSGLLQGGTQDNGTWQPNKDKLGKKWINTMIGDGGQSGFDIGNPDFRFHTFYDASPDVNFSAGAMEDWNWIADPIYGTGGQFYVPIISDPKVSKTMFVGAGNVWRTKTNGMGTMTVAELREHCNEWTGDFSVQCGDWAQIASPRLTSSSLGDRSGGAVAATERATSDTSTLWAATTTGRVFISKNVDAEPASAVTWTRLDSLSSTDPNRFISGIYIDPANANHAWISYQGFDASTPATPGHLFEVTYDGVGAATWVDRSYDYGDLPMTDVVRDDATGDLYVSSDFGVFRLASGDTSWTSSGTGMPNIEVAGLTIVPGERILYAASHSMGAWRLNLP